MKQKIETVALCLSARNIPTNFIWLRSCILEKQVSTFLLKLGSCYVYCVKNGGFCGESTWPVASVHLHWTGAVFLKRTGKCIAMRFSLSHIQQPEYEHKMQCWGSELTYDCFRKMNKSVDKMHAAPISMFISVGFYLFDSIRWCGRTHRPFISKQRCCA